MELLIFGSVIGLIVVLAIFGALAAKKRREELATLSLRLGLSYRAEQDAGLADRFAFLDRHPRVHRAQ
ncbi:MAG: hypothetical protein U5M53_03000 [Rhodoferax sp.]|nr:hypothetical protein [Rhodoferax sp.]